MVDRIPLLPVKVFFSSPGDLFPERAIAKSFLTQELANYPHLKERYAFLPYAYEDVVPPIVGEEPQLTVDKYLLEPQEADIVICLLWARMGTPTISLLNPETGQPYHSGTEYELLTAYRNRRPDGTPHILLYHCSRPAIDSKRQTAEQQAQVAALLTRFHQGGDLKGLVQDFTDGSDLRDKLRIGLLQVIEHDFKPVLEAQLAELRRERTRVYLFDGPLSNHYVPRPEAEDLLRRTLLGSRARIGVVAEMALTGMGGLGKTMLARALCEDSAVQGAFPDGILWATLGQQARPLEQQRRWIVALGGNLQNATSEQLAKDELQRLLRDRAMLLVLDDVWNAADAEVLRVGGPKCRILFTTRNSETTADTQLVPLSVMSRAESRAVLQQASGGVVDVALSELIAGRLGDLPLALTLVAGQLHFGVRWETIEMSLARYDLRFGSQQQKTVLSALASSIEALSPEDCAPYLELVIFPADTPLDLAAVARLWGKEWLPHGVDSPTRELRPASPLTLEDSDYLLGRLRARSLVQQDGTLHDLYVDYLRSIVPENEQQTLHGALVDGYGSAASWPVLPADELYAWRWLAWHLKLARRFTDLVHLVTDARYLESKIGLLGTEAAVRDIELVGNGDETMQLLIATLRLSAYVLDDDPSQLISQVTGRIGVKSPLHDTIDIGAERTARLRLISPTLATPGGPLIRTLTGHTNDVCSVAITPDGTYAVSGSFDSSVRIWDLRRGVEVHCLTGHKGYVNCVAVSPDGSYVVSGASDATVKIWDLVRGTELRSFQGHSGPVQCVAIAAQGAIISGSMDGTAKVWNAETGAELETLRGHSYGLTCVVISRDGRYAFTGSEDGTVRKWDLTIGTEVDRWSSPDDMERHTHTPGVFLERPLPPGPGVVLALALSPDESCLLVTSERSYGIYQIDLSMTKDEREKLADAFFEYGFARSHADMHPLHGHFDDKRVTALAISPDGRYALAGIGIHRSAGRDNAVVSWDLETKQVAFSVWGHPGKIHALALAADSVHLITGAADALIKYWAVGSQGNRPSTLLHHLHHDRVDFVAGTYDGERAVAIGAGKLSVWNVRTGDWVHDLVGDGDDYWWIAPDGRQALSWSKIERCIHFWDVEQALEILRIADIELAWPWPSLVITPDGRFVVGTTEFRYIKIIGHIGGLRGSWRRLRGRRVDFEDLVEENKVTVWNIEQGGSLASVVDTTEALRQDPQYREGPIRFRKLIVTPDSRYIVATIFTPRTATYDFLGVWDLQTGSHVKTLMHRDAAVNQFGFLPDGKHLAAICSIPDYGEPKYVYVWNIDTGQLEKCASQLEHVRCAALIAQNQWVAFGSWDGAIELWDLLKFEHLITVKGSGSSVGEIARTSSRDRLVYISGNNTLQVYDLPTRSNLGSFTPDLPLTSCALGPDGETVFAGDNGGGVHILRLS